MTANLFMDKYVRLQFKASLREQQRELQQAIDSVEEELRATLESTSDHLDLSSGNATREAMAARNTQNRRKLRTIEVALERIQNGSFGTCTACGGGIGLKRLQAIPSATCCLECQQRREEGVFDVVTDSSSRPDSDYRQDSTL
jgi:DnaK suppressor protein